MIHTFDDPCSDETKSFWDQLVHAKAKHSRMCGEPPLRYTISGWILGFFSWNSTGSASRMLSKGLCYDCPLSNIVLDDVKYGEAYLEHLPVGYGKVKVMLLPRGPSNIRTARCLIAGSLGKSIVDGAPEGHLGQATFEQSRQSARAEDDKHVKSDSRQTAWMFKRLSGSFNRLKASHEPRDARENRCVTRCRSLGTARVTLIPGHSTIQPCSGWALFEPYKEDGPIFDVEEISGPTVDALNSCANLEHGGTGAPAKPPKTEYSPSGAPVLPPLGILSEKT